MKTIFIISSMICLVCACHDTSDHNIHAPAGDTIGNTRVNKHKDTSDHTGSIPATVGKMIADLKLVPPVIGPGEAFSQLMIIHRTAVKEMCQIESSVGSKEEIFLAVQGIESRTYRLLVGFEGFLRENVPGKKLNTLRYEMPFTKETVDSMIHQGSTTTDNEFVKMLIAIEKSEIILAQSYLKEGRNKFLRSLANEIIITNRKEIDRFYKLKN